MLKSKSKQDPRDAVLAITGAAVQAMRSKHSEAARASSTPKTVSVDPKTAKKIVELRADLKKKYKQDVLTTVASGGRVANVDAMPSGWQALDDLITGETDKAARTVAGTGVGWPRGRIIEIYGDEAVGKTTLALLIVAAFQRAGEEAAYVDAEHALDVAYAGKLGVDLERLLLSQPDSAEQGLQVTDQLCESGAFGVVVVDSVAALVPEAELEGDMGDKHVGLQARLMSQACRKLTGIVDKSNTLLVFINQTRLKIGVMYGNPKCLHQDTPIPFVDGSSHTIREVVEKELPGPVWAFSEIRGFYPSMISEHHYNGEADPKNGFLTISSRGPGNRSGVFSATVSPTHKFLTKEGWRSACELTTEDKLVTKYENRINGTAMEFFHGMMCGDVHLKVRSRVGASIKLQDSSDAKYVTWKRNLCAPWLGSFRPMRAASGSVSYETPETFDILNAAARFGGRRDPMGMLSSFSWLSMAVWLMDDGHFDHKSHHRYILSVKRLRGDTVKQREISAVLDLHNLEHTWSKAGAIIFTVATSMMIAEKIAPFVPACMRRKLPTDVAARVPYVPIVLTFDARLERAFVDVIEVRRASARKYRSRGYYDISVPDGRDYLAGGVANGFVVHNTTTGGNALKFYASVRLEMVNVKTMKKGTRVTGRRIRIRAVKNKVAPPFREVYADFEPNVGIARVHADPDLDGGDDD